MAQLKGIAVEVGNSWSMIVLSPLGHGVSKMKSMEQGSFGIELPMEEGGSDALSKLILVPGSTERC